MKLAKPLLVAVASLTLTACVGAPREVDEQTGTTREAALTTNALSFNALSFNALSFNALSFNALSFNALSFNALSFNGLTSDPLMMNALENPLGQELFTYIVSCALPADASIDLTIQGTPYEFHGGLGLAPQWGEPNGFCDVDCQEWVSACLLARLDYQGVTREISLRGDNPALAVGAQEAAAYTVGEAAYFGNIFTGFFPQERYACLYPGQTEIERVCGPTLAGCAVDVDPNVTCAEVCGHPREDGSFPDCRPGSGQDWWDFPHHATITVYLEPGEP